MLVKMSELRSELGMDSELLSLLGQTAKPKGLELAAEKQSELELA